MPESMLLSQLDFLVSNTVTKVLGISKLLAILAYVSIAHLFVSIFLAFTLYLSIPHFTYSCVHLFILFRFKQMLVFVKKLDFGRDNFPRLINNQESVKAILLDSFQDGKSSIGKSKTKIKVSKLIETVKLFLDLKKSLRLKT
ncbi:hypothetical protein NQT74_10075 [Alteromonas stellipolaris]|uniref:hypothetical protein n=1 Tax=Alteromonas stellipolaris TaxID=233316 RepID=UPI00211878E4|nr:hypothetical protein [Alteromonas stellipolaris]MCQ8848927.1 hypothetical protein [Alteromonas stellipolaris]